MSDDKKQIDKLKDGLSSIPKAFVLFGRAFKNAKKDFWISIQVLFWVSLVLSFIFYFVEHTAQPDEYRNWWQMIPNLAESDDNFKSWPSGNMTIACMMFSPLMSVQNLGRRAGARIGIKAAEASVCIGVAARRRAVIAL